MRGAVLDRTVDLEARLLAGRLLSRRVQIAVDVLVFAGAFLLAYLLRFEFAIPSNEVRHGALQLLLVVMVQLLMSYAVGVHKFIWRYVGMAELRTFMLGAAASALPILLLRVALPETLQAWRVPISVIIVDTVLGWGSLLMTRVLRRASWEYSEAKLRARNNGAAIQKPVLLIGAGRAGVLAAREIRGRGDANLEIRGFIDDDPRKRRTKIQGVKVLGTVEDLPRLVKALKIDHVVITIAAASRERMRHIVSICESIPVRVRIIPGLYEILQGKVEISRIRDVQIEDLLGREPVHLDEDIIKRSLTDKRVLVTGAGGSIGSELARQTAGYRPSRLLLMERAEGALFNIHRELIESYPGLSIVPLLADVGDAQRISSIFKEYQPQVVLHAAAHKHVPMMEMNACEAIKNNVLATHCLGRLAGSEGVEVFVMISTDKAVNPTSVMGASKRMAELVIQNLNEGYDRTRFVAVRFGNVIGSAGSVVPIFQEQIRKGGPVTVTDVNMKRYFMTIPEAAQLVLQAGSMGEGGEIFILDMGAPVSIMDLARDTITRSGLKPDEDIKIEITGLRPGEKLFEELEISGENITKTRHPKIYIGKIAAFSAEQVNAALEQLGLLASQGQDHEIRRCLNAFLPKASLEVRDPAPLIQEEIILAEKLELSPGAVSVVE